MGAGAGGIDDESWTGGGYKATVGDRGLNSKWGERDDKLLMMSAGCLRWHNESPCCQG